jgi:hypothetical protein
MGIRALVCDLRSAMRRRHLLPIISMPPVQSGGLATAAVWGTLLPAVGNDIQLKNTIYFTAGHTGTTALFPWGWAIYFTKTNTGADSTATLLVKGYDILDRYQTEIITIAGATTAVQTTLCYKELVGIQVIAKANGSNNDTLAIGFVGNVGSNVTMKVATPFEIKQLSELRYITQAQGGIVASVAIMVPNALDVSNQTVNFVGVPTGTAYTATQPILYACHALRSANGQGHPNL